MMGELCTFGATLEIPSFTEGKKQLSSELLMYEDNSKVYRSMWNVLQVELKNSFANYSTIKSSRFVDDTVVVSF